MARVVLASGNKGKLAELADILSGLPITLLAQSEFAVVECPETGLSFVENAILKARNAAQHTGLPAIADDSGISVDVLAGAPGIYSARYAGASASDEQNLRKLLEEVAKRQPPKATCRFICVVVYLRHARDPLPLICQGVWEGCLLDAPQGSNGFGYDPIFWVPEFECSAAQLPSETKNKVSHRGQALQKLTAQLAIAYHAGETR